METEPVKIAVAPETPVRVFEVVLRGYRRDEVDAYVNDTEAELAELHFAVESAATGPALLARQKADVIRLREELTAEQADWQPSFSALGRSAEQILVLAQEEADELIRSAEREAGHARERIHRECEDLRRRAQAAAVAAEQKAQSQLAAVRAEAERLRTQSEQEIATRTAAANDEATGMLNTAAIAANEQLAAARAEAARLVEKAHAEVGAVKRERAELLAEVTAIAERMQALAQRDAGTNELREIRTA